MRKALTQALAEPKSHENLSPEVRKKIDLLLAEETDIVLWAGDDGSVAARSVLVSFVFSILADLMLIV